MSSSFVMWYRPSESLTYENYIRDWYSGFKDLVEGILEAGKTLYVIAISRKMPRFFSWLKKEERYYGVEGLGALLDKVEYTTEHAIPFIFNTKSHKEFEVIVVDDSMVYGNTMRNVSEDVWIYTGGKSPYVSIIVSGLEANMGLIKYKGYQFGAVVQNDEVSRWMDYVSSCNAAAELPVDVEFPIFHLDKFNQNSYYQKIEVEGLSAFSYELGSQSVMKSCNILLDEDLVELTAMDFSKSRCFFAEDEVRIVVISPFSVLQNSIYDASPFRSDGLTDIWLKIRDSVALKRSYRTNKSLVVMLNYLHSINTFRRHINKILPTSWNHYSLEIEDLMFLVGRPLAEFLVEKLSAYLISNYRNTFVIVNPGLPSVCVPKELKTPYMIQRRMIASKQRNERNAYVLIGALFDQSRFDKSILGQNVTLFHRMYSSFFESFDSLKELVASVFDVENLDKEINKSVDALIDTGKIIPKYIRTSNSQGEVYWKRYFTSAHSSVEL